MRLAAAALLVAACAGAGHEQAAELDCQRRIVEAADLSPAPPGGAAGAFEAARQRLETLDRSGCNEQQIGSAEAAARAAARVAAAAARIGDVGKAAREGRTPRSDGAILEFTHELEQYEGRTAALARSLERMRAEAKGN